MSWTALVPANPNQTGFPNQCLGQAQRVFGAPGTHYCAYDAWTDADFKHADRELPDVPVPIWFDNWLTIGTEYRNFGHVAVWFPDRKQFLNVPAKGNGQMWLNSIDQVKSWNGCGNYLGWTEDINGLRVARYDTIDNGSTTTGRKQRDMMFVIVKESGIGVVIGEYSILEINPKTDPVEFAASEAIWGAGMNRVYISAEQLRIEKLQLDKRRKSAPKG